MKRDILIVDDEDLFREDLAELLRDAGFECRTARDGEAGLAAARAREPALILCDVVMPRLGGMEFLEACTRELPRTSVILLTAHGRMDAAIQAFRRGACDYILKPVEPDDLIAKCRKVLESEVLRGEVERLRREVSRHESLPGMVGESAPVREVFRTVLEVAPISSNVLVSGESGTGKELVARAIHQASAWRSGPFVAVNCAALPDTLLESQLFGHVKGAFTGAHRNHTGYFEAAQGGTLFLDEISEMPLAVQPKLLRALELREVVPVGATRPIVVQTRFVASSNRRLRTEVAEGRFREDLYFRIRVVEIVVPPLRDRKEDIPLLTAHFVARFNAEMKKAVVGADRDALRRLTAYPWPGNVRELQNTIERAMISARGDWLLAKDLPAELAEEPSNGTPRADDLRAAVRTYESEHIRTVLRECGGNREEAARRMGINPSTLYRKMAELEIRDEP